MTDDELVRACAEKIMGWTASEGARPLLDHEFMGMDPRHYKGLLVKLPGKCARFGWNPLTDETDNAAVLDKMVSLIGNVSAFDYPVVLRHCIHPDTGWVCCFRGGEYEGQASHPDRKRAVVVAALQARGVAVEP